MKIAMAPVLFALLAALVGCTGLLRKGEAPWESAPPGGEAPAKAEAEPDTTRAGPPDTATSLPPQRQGSSPGTPSASLKAGPADSAAGPPATADDKSAPVSVEEVNRYVLWCVERGLWREARAHLERAVSLDSTSVSLYNNLGIVYEYFGLEEEAKRAYQRAGALDPQSAIVLRNYDLFRLGGRPKDRDKERGERGKGE